MTIPDQYSRFGMPGATLAVYVNNNGGLPKIDLGILSTSVGGVIITALVVFAFLAIVSVILSELAAAAPSDQGE